MKTTITVGEQTLDVVCNGLTPILFKHIFHRDFIAEFGNFNDKMQELASKSKELNDLQNDLNEGKLSQEEYLERYKAFNISTDELSVLNDRTELLTQLAFVMNLQATESDTNKLFNTNVVKFYEFLSMFERKDLTSVQFSRQVTTIWKGESTTTIKSKNA